MTGRATRLRRRVLGLARFVGVVAVIALPLAVLWGVGQARATDYLGPHRSTFNVTYDHAVVLDLGPLGRATLPQHWGPLGVEIEVGPLGSASGTSVSVFSEQTLAQYASLYADPDATIGGVGELLLRSAIWHAVGAEVVLVGLGVLWRRRGSYLVGAALDRTGTRRGLLAYGTVVVLVAGSVLAPAPPDDTPNYRVTVVRGTPFEGMTVDNGLLADLLNRGISGARLLADRQLAAIDTYVATATANLDRQQADLPAPRDGETMFFGVADLHCSQAMTRVYADLLQRAVPSVIFSAGDDTMNGTAAERGCITREVALSRGLPGPEGAEVDVPFVVATGNHDSAITDGQFARAGASVLDGRRIESADLTWLGDDDPEEQIPFSISRRMERPENETELGQRILGAAASDPVDVIVLHQPTATLPIIEAPDPPARLVVWGHIHTQNGPSVIPHDDGSWTVALQLGTAGGIAQPTATSFSTPFSPPRKTAESYYFFRDTATGLITGVQAVRFGVDGSVEISERVATGNLGDLSEETRAKLSQAQAQAPASVPQTPIGSPAPTETPDAPVQDPANG